MSSAAELVSRFADLRVLVIGEAMLDRYISGPSTRLSPEAAVPVVAVERCDEYPGGAANSAANAAAMGAKTRLLTLLGDDAAGARLSTLIAQSGVELDPASVVTGRRTLQKSRVVAGATPVVRFDEGDTGSPAASIDGRRELALRDGWARCDAVIISDYGYGALGPGLRACIKSLQAAEPRILAVDARNLSLYCDCQPSVVKPNLAEARHLAGVATASFADESAEIDALRGPLLERTSARIVALTLGALGAAIFERDGTTHRTFARPFPQSRAAGAGDSYLAAFGLGLAAGGDPACCAIIAAQAAQAVAEREGTRTCSAAELLGLLRPATALTDLDSLRRQLEVARADCKRIVFTNGVFDLLHSGHVRYLAAARALGDLLVVGLNSDASVTRLKGPTRPVNGLGERAAVLAALSCVDHVAAFEEDTPERLIAAVRPNVFVKGGDYTREQLPEADLVESLGGSVVLLDHHEGLSTTRLIQRVHAMGTLRELLPAAMVAP